MKSLFNSHGIVPGIGPLRFDVGNIVSEVVVSFLQIKAFLNSIPPDLVHESLFV